MQNRILIRSLLLFLVTICLAIAINSSGDIHSRGSKVSNDDTLNVVYRNKRAVTRRPGFLKTLFQVVFEQWNDTRNTISSVNKQINDNFLPENAPVVETTTPSDPNVSTTTMAYKITRSEFNKILQRNLKGIVRLFNIELQDALKQSEKNYAEFKKNASIEISKYL